MYPVPVHPGSQFGAWCGNQKADETMTRKLRKHFFALTYHWLLLTSRRSVIPMFYSVHAFFRAAFLSTGVI